MQSRTILLIVLACMISQTSGQQLIITTEYKQIKNINSYCALAKLKSITNSKVFLLDSMISYKFKSATDSFSYAKEEYSYDSYGNKILKVSSTINLLDTPLLYSSKFEWIYNSTGQCTSEIYSTWNEEAGIWKGSHKSINYFDKEQEPVKIENFYWNENTNEWEFSNKDEIEYNAYSDIITRKTTYWNDSVYNFKIDLNYDETGRTILEIEYDSDNKIINHTSYNYNSSSNTTTIISTRLTDEDDTVHSKVEITDSISDRIIKEVQYSGSGEPVIWTKTFETQYSYDENNKLLSISRILKWYKTDEWTICDKDVYTYNANGSLNTMTNYVISTETNSLYVLNKLFYFFSTTDSLKEYTQIQNTGQDIAYYPNPFKSQLNIKPGIALAGEQAWLFMT